MKMLELIRLIKLCREAEGYLDLGLPKLALTTLTRIESKSIRDFPRLLLVKGEALRRLNSYHSALECFDELIMRKEFAFLYSLSASCYKGLGRLEKATEAMKRALELEPEAGIHHFNLARFYSLSGFKYRTLDELAKVGDLGRNIGEMIQKEPDFDSLRDDPDFIRTVRKFLPDKALQTRRYWGV